MKMKYIYRFFFLIEQKACFCLGAEERVQGLNTWGEQSEIKEAPVCLKGKESSLKK